MDLSIYLSTYLPIYISNCTNTHTHTHVYAYRLPVPTGAEVAAGTRATRASTSAHTKNHERGDRGGRFAGGLSTAPITEAPEREGEGA